MNIGENIRRIRTKKYDSERVGRKIYNMLNRAAGGRAPFPFRVLRKGVVLMSTYEEFMIILTAVNVIIAILNYTHKK